MKKLLLCLPLLFSFALLQAQNAMPVKWTFEAENTGKNEYELIITADVEHGWYVYSQYLESDEGPVATTFSFDDVKRLELIGKTTETGAKKEGFDELFEMNIVKFKDKVKFIQKIKTTKGIEEVTGYVEFMTCDNTRCLPPTEVPFTISLK